MLYLNHLKTIPCVFIFSIDRLFFIFFKLNFTQLKIILNINNN